MDIRKFIITKTIAVAMSALSAMNYSSKLESSCEDATIRVLLMTDEYGGYFHDEVDYEMNENGDGFQLFSIQRACGHPNYSGTLEVKNTPNGYLLINEVKLEEYVKCVVPSEMPASYHLEALKAQAICARTYAFKQMNEGKLLEYAADVDDSTSYQVYNNYEGNEMTDRAVDETKGLIMTYEGEPIDAYFFSTSSGATSTDEVWERASAPCLKSIVTNYEEDMPWYRWNVFFPKGKVEELLMKQGYQIGEILSIQITKKSQGGAAVCCEFFGTRGTASVSNEYDIRALLSPYGLEIYRQDETIVTDFSILPSAYIQIEAIYEEGHLTGFSIKGGGYGHGVGMSQNGANEMAKRGYTCFDILNYYYKDFELQNAFSGV